MIGRWVPYWFENPVEMVVDVCIKNKLLLQLLLTGDTSEIPVNGSSSWIRGRNELKNFLDSELKSFVEQRMKFVYELMFAEMVDMAITIDENALRDNQYLCNGNFEKWYDEQMQKDNDFVKDFTFKLGKVYQIYNEE